jgi:murein DD-endopeptidase MepM/ murein hydrolase activator NlpD
MRKKRYRSYHIIIIPYDKVRSKEIFFSVKSLKFITIGAIALVLIVTTLISLHTVNYQRIRTALYPTMRKNTVLMNENREMTEDKDRLVFIIDSLTSQLHSERAVHREKLKALNVQAERIKKFAENLRIMAGFKLDPKHKQPPGLGGPIPEEEDKNFLKVEDVESEEILSSFLSAESSLFKKMSKSNKDLRFLWSYFENKSSVIEGTPEMQPVPGFILSGFGYRIDPFSGREEFHKGVDIPAPTGTKIKAPAAGVVIFAGRRGGYGKIIVIDHGNNYKTVYGHLHEFDVEVGDRVQKGDFIGEVGNTGRSTGSHLHYEVRLNDVAVNPVNYFKSVEERKKDLEEKEETAVDSEQ